MAHQDKGHYAQKHPDKAVNPEIIKEIKAATKDGILTCTSAHRLSKVMGCLPEDIGTQADLAEVPIGRCQLGLFGFSLQKKNLNPDIEIPEELRNAILAGQSEGRMSCSQCWELAKACKISRNDMGSACEKLEIKIKPCQLGAF